MSHERNPPDSNGINRRQALWRLAAATVPLNLWLTSATEGDVGLQLGAPRNLRIVGDTAPSLESPLNRGLHPRTLLTPTMAETLRTQIKTDGSFRQRWQ